jgi:hypothetical protein
MTDTTPHRATAEQWADIEQWGGTLTACLLELRSRLEALEAGATCPHIVSSDEGTSYCRLAEQQAAASAPPEPMPAGSLVERVGHAIASADEDCLADRLLPFDSWLPEARAAILAVAEWLRGHHPDGDPVAATALEREAKL